MSSGGAAPAFNQSDNTAANNRVFNASGLPGPQIQNQSTVATDDSSKLTMKSRGPSTDSIDSGPRDPGARFTIATTSDESDSTPPKANFVL